MAHASDLIDHFKLDTEFFPDYVQHVSLKSDASRLQRKIRVVQRWRRQEVLGHGAFGIVWLEKENDGETRAVKEVSKITAERASIDYTRELAALAKLSKHNEFFVQLLGWYENKKSIFLSMEYFQLGDLAECLTAPAPEQQAKVIASQLLEGLLIMHDLGFTHRDLKPKNIFVVSQGPDWWVKIGDFGISKRIVNDDTGLCTTIGTTGYLAPEVLGYPEDSTYRTGYTNAVDVWSLGCVLCWTVTQKAPFPTRAALSMWSNGISPFPSELLDANKISDPGLQFIMSTMQIAPQKRPTASSALQCLWFENSDQNSGAIDLKAIKNELQHVETGLRTQHRIGKTVSDPVALASNETLRQHPRQGSFDADPELRRDHREILQDSNPATDREEISTEGQRKESDLATEFQGTLVEEQDLETEIIIMPEDVLALHNAAWEGDKELVYQLLKKGVDIEAKQDAIVPRNLFYSLFSLGNGSYDGPYHCRQTALHQAARKGHEAVVSLLLKMGANFEANDGIDGNLGWRPLHYAIRCGHTGTAQLLLDGGANIEAPGMYEVRPLHIAAAGFWKSPFALTLERGADTSAETNLSFMKKLIDHGAAVNGKDKYGRTPLHQVRGTHAKEKVRILLNAGAEHASDDLGYTPLIYAVRGNNQNLAKSLLECGAEVNTKYNINGNTPLINAAERGRLGLTYLLLKHGADVNTTNELESSALHYAVHNAQGRNLENWRRIIEKLLENGADPRLKNMRGQTPLDIAKVEGRGLPELIRKGREEYLTCTQPIQPTQPTQPTAPKPRRGIRGWFSSREDKASLPHWH